MSVIFCMCNLGGAAGGNVICQLGLGPSHFKGREYFIIMILECVCPHIISLERGGGWCCSLISKKYVNQRTLSFPV